MVPTPDYLQYAKLADQLDDLTERIDSLISAVQVRGIYDSTMEQLASLLATDTGQNAMYPVDNMAAYLGKGSTGSTIQNVVQFLPIDMIAAVLAQLYQAREVAKQNLFEISGISDIVRGQLQNKYERLGQTEIKGEYAGRRGGTRRRKMNRCVRDTLRLKAEIIIEYFSDATFRALSGFDQMPDTIRILKAAGDDGEKIVEEIWTRVLGLLRDERERGFRIDIETDSTIALDDQEEVGQRIEFLKVVGDFFERSLATMQAFPVLTPLVGEITLFAVRSFRAGRGLESAFEDATRKLQMEVEQAQKQEPPPDPAQVKAEMDAQGAEQKLQIDQASAAIDLKAKQAAAEIDAEAQMREAEIEGIVSMQELEVKAAELELKREALGIKRAELAAKATAKATTKE